MRRVFPAPAVGEQNMEQIAPRLPLKNAAVRTPRRPASAEGDRVFPCAAAPPAWGVRSVGAEHARRKGSGESTPRCGVVCPVCVNRSSRRLPPPAAGWAATFKVSCFSRRQTFKGNKSLKTALSDGF